MKIFSAEHLPRDLKIIGSMPLILGFLAFLQADFQNILTLIAPISVLFLGISYFALAFGVSKKEKWVWLSGLIFFGFQIIFILISVLLGLIPLLSTILGFLIPTFFLFTFIKESKRIAVNPVSNILPFIVVIIGILLVISFCVSTIYLRFFS